MPGLSELDLVERGAIDAARKIVQQPAKRREFGGNMQSQAANIRSCLRAPFAHSVTLHPDQAGRPDNHLNVGS